jgi:hypothetical protein
VKLATKKVKSPIASNVLAYMVESREASSNMSQKQPEIVAKELKKNANKILGSGDVQG